MDKSTRILLDGLEFPEGPRWHDHRLWFSDMTANRVMAVDMAGKAETIIQLDGPCSGLGWLPGNHLLVVSMIDRCLLRLDTDGLRTVADLSELATYHCNDMVVDKNGRAYIGNFGFDLFNAPEPAKAEIIMVESHHGEARVVADDLLFPNGTVITPDGKQLIVGETYGACLTAFDILPDGSLTGRRRWATLKGAVPDGICLDAEGAIWVASPISQEVFRIHKGGTVTHRIDVETQAYACMLGGPDRRTLFIATSGGTPASGRIEMVTVEVPGAGLP